MSLIATVVVPVIVTVIGMGLASLFSGFKLWQVFVGSFIITTLVVTSLAILKTVIYDMPEHHIWTLQSVEGVLLSYVWFVGASFGLLAALGLTYAVYYEQKK